MEPNQENSIIIEKKSLFKHPLLYIIIAIVAVIIAGLLLIQPAKNLANIVTGKTADNNDAPSVSADDSEVDPDKLMDLTLDEWLDNINEWQSSYDVGSPIKRSDLETDGEGGYTLYLYEYVTYQCYCPEDDRIFAVGMSAGGNGTDESLAVVMYEFAGFIQSLHPEYTTEEIGETIDALMNINEAGDSFVRTTIEKDGTFYIFEVVDGSMVITASAIYLCK